MKRPLVLLWILLATLTPFRARAEQQWVEVKSPHFTVMTDGGEKRGREVATRFEQMRMAFGVIFQKVRLNTAPLEIVAFRNSKEMKQYAPLYQGKPIDVAGLFLGDGGHGRTAKSQDRQYILLDLSQEENWLTVFHEYAHLLINSNFSETPLWFDEGFAEYCSSLKVNNREIDLGLPRNDLLYTLTQSGWLHLVDLFSVGHDSKIYNRDDRRSLLYAQSWLTVHFFMSKGMLKQVSEYVHYTQNEHQPVPDAIRHAFGMQPEQLEKAISNYFRGNETTHLRAPAPPGSDKLEFSSQPLNDVDQRVILADLDFHARDYRPRGIGTLEQVIASQPDNAIANRDLGFAALEKNDWDKAEGFFRRAAASQSNDPEMHYLVALGLYRKNPGGSHPPEELELMKKELSTAIALDPNYADAYGLLGMTLGFTNETAKAAETLKKAIQLDPRNEWNYSNLANVYMRAQDFDSALALLQRLRGSSDPRIATMAARQMESVQTYKAEVERWKQSAAQGANGQKVVEGQPSEYAKSGDVPVSGQPVLRKAEPVLFMKGILNSVDCSSSPEAVLTVTSAGKKWKMVAQDAKKLIVMGADSLSCSWSNRKVAVNYRKTGEAEGQLVTVELE